MGNTSRIGKKTSLWSSIKERLLPSISEEYTHYTPLPPKAVESIALLGGTVGMKFSSQYQGDEVVAFKTISTAAQALGEELKERLMKAGVSVGEDDIILTPDARQGLYALTLSEKLLCRCPVIEALIAIGVDIRRSNASSQGKSWANEVDGKNSSGCVR